MALFSALLEVIQKILYLTKIFRHFILNFSSALDMYIPDPHEFTGKALALLLNTAPPNSSFAKLSAHSASYNKTLDRKYLNQ